MKIVLVQAFPVTATLTTVYTVPNNAKLATINTITITNQSSVATTFRIRIFPACSPCTVNSQSQYIFYDTPLCGNETVLVQPTMPISSKYSIAVYSLSGTVSFNISLTEL